MNKFVIIGIVVVIVVGIAFFFLRNMFKEESETTTLYCGPDKSSPVIVFKNPSKAFPAFAYEYTAKVGANISAMDSLQKVASAGGGSIDLNNKIVELRDKLNNESSRMEMLMKSNFFAYNSKPCDTSISRQYFQFLALMAEKNTELEKLKSDITVATASTGADTTKIAVIKDTAKIRQALIHFEKQYTFHVSAAVPLVPRSEMEVHPQVVVPDSPRKTRIMHPVNH